MLTFEPKPPYVEIHNRYPELWTIVSSPEACIRMRMSAALKVPVVHGFDLIEDMKQILTYIAAHDHDSRDYAHRLIGYMCGEVMEQLGYEPGQRKNLSKENKFFKSGLVYRRKDPRMEKLKEATPATGRPPS